MVKPVDLCVGIHVRCVRDESELADAWSALAGLWRNAREQPRPAEVLLEELLDGDEVSVETVTYRNRTEAVAVTGKVVAGFPAFVEAGHVVPSPVPAASRTRSSGWTADPRRSTGTGRRRGGADVDRRAAAAGPALPHLPGSF